jgi:hypothetical protein
LPALVFLALVLAGALSGPQFQPARFGAFSWQVFPFRWDGNWYRSIAQGGYSWNPAVKTGQNLAFFPLEPLLLYLVHGVSGLRWWQASWLLQAATGAFAVWAFLRLAAAYLSPKSSQLALWAFLLFPASLFLLPNYPVGLLEGLACWSLLELKRGRLLPAGLLAGLASAAGPVGIALAFPIAWASWPKLRAGQAWSWAPPLLSVCGLLLFMVYQALRFHDALAFVQAQAAWASVGLGTRLLRFFTLFPIWRSIYWGLRIPVAVNMLLLENAAFLLGGLISAWWTEDRRLRLYAYAVLLITLFFQASASNLLLSTARLIYPAVPLFLLLGKFGERHPWIFWLLMAGFGLLLANWAGRFALNYWVQ